jgi:hypothetical protein
MSPLQTIPYKSGCIYRRKRRAVSLALKAQNLPRRTLFAELWLCNPALGLAGPEPRGGAHYLYWLPFKRVPRFGPSSALGYCLPGVEGIIPQCGGQ